MKFFLIKDLMTFGITIKYLVLYISVFFISYIGIEVFRRWIIRKKILDIPNERSSHQRPTPKGGGLIIAFVCILFFSIYQIYYAERFVWSYIVGAGLIVLISWLDDVFEIGAIWRLLFHIVAAVLIVLQMSFWQVVYVPYFGEIFLGQIMGGTLTVIWIVWLINAYNFMDGIDGIAGIQALTASIGWSLFGWLFNIEFLYLFGLVIFFSTLGFLMHNWQPAKIFMGDVGSAFLGYTFAVFPFLIPDPDTPVGIQKFIPFLTVTFVWLFVFDTFVTLLKRLWKKEKVWKAHRQHLYQKLVIKKFSHSVVAQIYGLLSLLIILGVNLILKYGISEIIIISLIVVVTTVLMILIYSKITLTKFS